MESFGAHDCGQCACGSAYHHWSGLYVQLFFEYSHEWFFSDAGACGFGLILEFRRGTLIMVVLAQLNKPMYGYSLVKELEGKGISIEGNTLYPLLRRLESQGLLKSEWETEATKPRKYYIITEDGKLVYKKIKEHWKKFSQSINVLMEEE